MFETIFTIKNEHLQRLNADEAVLFFADLLRAETRRLSLPDTSVNISSRTNVPDGGVDAVINVGVPPNRFRLDENWILMSLVPVRGYQPLRNADLAVNLPFSGVVELSA